MDNAEKMARIIEDNWRSAKTRDTWFQIRSWIHGAYLVESDPDISEDLVTLYEVAKAHQKDADRV